MSTNSGISIKTTKGGKTIYSHWDGYPSHHGRILQKFYNTEEKVKQLIALGSISILGETIGEKVEFNGFDCQVNKQTLAYGRDRGEKNVKATSFKEIPTETHQFNYLFDKGVWYVSTHNKPFVLLTNKIIESDNVYL